MADLSYKIAVDTANANNSINTLKNGLIGLAAAFSIKELVGFSDGILTIKNRLLSLGNSTASVEKQFTAIAAIATTARAPLGAVGDLYFRIARAADSLGISQRESADITMSLSKALAMTGMSAAEAAGPLLQIGQALQSGRFAGDELRSVLEGMPTVTQALAKELGVTVGELRKLGAEGKITGDVFVKAMQNAKQSIDDGFAKTIPTISQSLEVLKTKFSLFIDQFEKNTGLFAGLASAIILVSDVLLKLSEAFKENKEGITVILKMVAALTAAYLLMGPALTMVTGAQNAMFIAMNTGRTVFAFLTAQLIGIKVGLVAFGTNLLKATGLMAGTASATAYLTAAIGALAKTMLRLLGWVGIIIAVAEAVNYLIKAITGIDVLKVSLDWIGDKFKQLGQWTGLWGKETEKAAETAIAALDATKKASASLLALEKEKALLIAKVRAELVKQAQGYFDSANEQERSLRIQNQMINATQLQIDQNSEIRQAESAYFQEQKRIQSELAKLKWSTKEEEKAQVGLLISQLGKLEDRYADQLSSIKKLVTEHERLARARNLDLFVLSEQLSTNKALTKSQDEMAKLSMTKIQQGYYDIAAAARDSARAAIEAEEARRKEKLDPAEAAAYYKAAEEGSRKVQEEHAKLIEQSRTFETGWSRAWNQYIEDARDASTQATSLFNNVMKGMEDMIVNFVKTGKLEWKSLFASMAEEILRNKIKEGFSSLMDELSSGTGVIGQVGEMLGLTGMSGGATKGSSYNNPMYVYDVAGGAAGGSGIVGQIGKAVGIDAFGGKGSDGGGIMSSLGGAAGGALGSVFGPVGTMVGSAVGKSIGGALSSVGDLAGDIISGIGDFFGGWFATGGTLPAGKWGVVGEKGPELIGGPANISPLFSGDTAIGGLSSTVSTLMDMINDLAGSVLGTNKEDSKLAVDSILGQVSGMIPNIGNFFDGGLGAGKFGIAGEAGPELIPGPATVSPLAGGTTVIYNINAVDARSFQQLLASDPAILYQLTEQGRKSFGGRR